MLILTRYRDGVIVLDFSAISDSDLADLRSGARVIEIVTVDIRSDRVRTGVDAPKSVGVHRKEYAAQLKTAETRKAFEQVLKR